MNQSLALSNQHPFLWEASLGVEHSFDKIILKRYDFSIARFDKSLFEQFGIASPAELNRAVDKRQAEFLAGRYAARQVLQTLGYCDIQIPVGQHRSPVWPEDIVASITHTSNTAICAAAAKDDVHYLGIDLENHVSTKTALEIKSGVLLEQEERLLRTLPVAFEAAFTLIFSAKESVFKALYPFVQEYFDFHAAALKSVCLDSGKISFELTEDLAPGFAAGTLVTGDFLITSEIVFTSIYKHR